MMCRVPRSPRRRRTGTHAAIAKSKGRYSCPRTIKWTTLFLLLICDGVQCGEGFNDKRSGLPRPKGELIHNKDLKQKEQFDPAAVDDDQRGVFRTLWIRGRQRGATVVGGVRAISLVGAIRRGGSTSSPPPLGQVDRWARSFTLFLGWVVSFQAIGNVIFVWRDNLFELASRLMSHDTMAAARTVRKILASVDDHGVIDVFSKYPPQELIASIYALSRIQAACQVYDRSTTSRLERFEFPDNDLLEDLHHYAPFAAATYGWKMDLATAGRLHRGDLQALVRMTNIDEDDVVSVNWESRANRPAFYIARDTRRKRIVLAIRGTWSAHDVLTDLCCTPEDYYVSSCHHRAHNGMLAAARGVASVAEEMIAQELEAHPDYTLLLVGHSLGGSVAAILGNLWEKTFKGVTAYAYGGACVSPKGDRGGANIVSVLSDGDPFSCLSLGHVADVSFALNHLCDNPDLRATILMRTDGSVQKLEKRDLEWCSEIMEKIHEQMVGEKLYPPGRLVFLSKPNNKRDGTCEAREVAPDFFRDLRIGPRMFDLSRHVPRLYEARLRNCRSASETSMAESALV